MENLKRALCAEFPTQPKMTVDQVFAYTVLYMCSHFNLGIELYTHTQSFDSYTITQEAIECSICYQGSDEEGGAPDICCDNCSKHYHKGCIFEVNVSSLPCLVKYSLFLLMKWFKGLPTSIYTTFQSISGECPYCSKVRIEFSG